MLGIGGSVTGLNILEVSSMFPMCADPEYAFGDVQKIGGYRAALGVPLLREGNVVGVIFLARTVPQPFNTQTKSSWRPPSPIRP